MGQHETSIMDIVKQLKVLQGNLLDTTYSGASCADVTQEIARRRRRDRIFPDGYFADVAWEILTDLYEAHQSGQRVSVTMLGVHGRVPLTTMLRYLDRLVTDDFVVRVPDAADRRRIHVALTERGIAAMDQVFASLATPTLVANIA